ncbi:MAG: MmcQ/YjbR family DNA-binding protein [Gemmataceae bacterium]|nr:MmcQ/YjbR family DNA-binding protein [Gemmataceae bacterium]
MTAKRKPARRKPKAGDPLGRVRKICLALPETSEKVAWGAPTFRVKGKLFVMFVDNHHQDGRVAIWCDAPAGSQQALVASDPEHFFVPPYVGGNGWLGVRLDRGLAWSIVKELIHEAHRTRAPDL